MKIPKTPSGKTTGRVQSKKPNKANEAKPQAAPAGQKHTCPVCGATFSAPPAIHAQFCPGKPATGPCEYCGAEEGDFRECRQCGKVLCEDCREPDLHNCGEEN